MSDTIPYDARSIRGHGTKVARSKTPPGNPTPTVSPSLKLVRDMIGGASALLAMMPHVHAVGMNQENAASLAEAKLMEAIHALKELENLKSI